MSMINRLQNINPGEKICYWKTGGMPWDKSEIFSTAFRLHEDDKVELVQFVSACHNVNCANAVELRDFEYFAIGKKYPPSPQKIALRQREARRLANEPDLVGGVV